MTKTKDKVKATEKTNTLRSVVQEYRDKATIVARMLLINSILKTISGLNRNIAHMEKDRDAMIKDYETTIYRTKKRIEALDKKDPMYEEDKASLEKVLAGSEKDLEVKKKNYEETIAKYRADVAANDEKITKIENGEIKVSIDEVNALSDDFINRS